MTKLKSVLVGLCLGTVIGLLVVFQIYVCVVL